MKYPVPSFRVQIIILFSALLTIAVLLFRSYFIDSFRDYRTQIDYLELEAKINEIYQEYNTEFAFNSEAESFKNDIENLLIDVKQIELTGDIVERELRVYSIFVYIFVVISVLVVFLISFGLITRPLSRLQEATKELARGNLNIFVKESKFSPINDLIASFNAMTAELVENRNKLLEAEKEMMWREMAQVMAHEIKNPLTPIRLQMQRMEHKYLMGSDNFEKVFTEALKIVNEEVDNLQSLVNQFRNFAKMPTANFTEYDLEEQLREIITPYEPEADIELVFEEDLPAFYGDKLQMKQVFVNLIQNAIQAMEEDRRLIIEIEYQNNIFIITITDFGTGIERDDMDKIFQPYFTKKKKGTGLGLAIVKRIVQSHEGGIFVDSTRDKGTTFTLKIGLKQKQHEQSEAFANKYQQM